MSRAAVPAVWRVLVAGCCVLLGVSGALAQQGMAEVLSTEGTVYVFRAATGKRLIVSPGTALSRGDVINTGRDSAARVRFSDGAELAVRANTSLAVEDYRFAQDRPAEDSLVLRLLKGGMRQISGLIGKRGSRDGYKLNTVTATIGIRGTDFTARLCEDDCRAEGRARTNLAANERPINNNPRAVSARVVSASGHLTAFEVTGTERKLAPGAPIYAGDQIRTDASGPAAIAFLDQTRVVVDRNSAFQVDSYRYVADRPQADNIALRLLKGGARILTGLVGKRSPNRFGVNTVTATIGIRGTSFDLVCAPGGMADPDQPAAAQLDGASCDEAVYAHTRDGTISLKVGETKELLLGKGKTGVALAPGAEAVPLPKLPDAIGQRAWPAPEGLRFDMNQLFGEDGTEAADPGLFVMVRDGAVAMTSAGGETAEFAAGESGRLSLDGQRISRFATTPRFMERDPMLSDRIIGFGVCRP